jgi:hypothetical protein
MQKYLYCPGRVNWQVQLPPGRISPESNGSAFIGSDTSFGSFAFLKSVVTVYTLREALSQRTASPAWTVTDTGENLKPSVISTVTAAGTGAAPS